MTHLDKPSRSVTRLTVGGLDGSHGKDRGRKLCIGLVYGDLITVRPHGTRRTETIRIEDLYSYVLRCKVNRSHMERLREAKEKKAQREQARKSRRIIRGGLNVSR